MLNFHYRLAARNYFSRREQRRLWIWVLIVGVPLIGLSHLAELWLGRPASREAQAEAIDTRIASAVRPPEIPGVFNAPPAVEEREPADADAYFSGVKSQLLESIRDDTPSRSAEHGIFSNLLEVLARSTDQQLQTHSTGSVAYVQLFRQPDVYRGKLVDLVGSVRRAYRLALSKNELGLEHYYQLWIQPRGAPNYTVVAYCLDLPPGFDLGDDLNEPVSLTGFFFKRWAYESKGGTMTAPMLLAKTVRWSKPAQAETSKDELSGIGWLTVVATICVVSLLVMLLVASRFATRSIVDRPSPRPEDIEALKNETQVDVKKELERLAREGG